MAQKKAHEVELFLKNKPQTYGILLIYGADKGLVSEYATLFAKNCGIDDSNAFAVVKMEADSLEKDPARLIDEARTLSFFGGKRLLWIRYSGSGNKSGFSEAVKFLAQAPLTDCYILIEAGDLKKTAYLRKIAEDSPQAVALPCYGDEGRAVQKLIDDVAGQFQCAINDEARALLQESLGNDRLISRGELEKLCLYAGANGAIDASAVKNAVSDGRAIAQDDVVDAVLCGDLTAFNLHFDRQILSGAPAFLILSAFMRRFQQLQDFRFQIEIEGKTAAVVLAAARPPIFFKRKAALQQALAFWSGAKIARAMARLQKTLLDSRKNSELGLALMRQNLLALAVEAARKR